MLTLYFMTIISQIMYNQTPWRLDWRIYGSRVLLLKGFIYIRMSRLGKIHAGITMLGMEGILV